MILVALLLSILTSGNAHAINPLSSQPLQSQSSARPGYAYCPPYPENGCDGCPGEHIVCDGVDYSRADSCEPPTDGNRRGYCSKRDHQG
jgi:hypothetical protein